MPTGPKVGIRKTVIKNEWQLSGRIGYKIQDFTEASL